MTVLTVVISDHRRIAATRGHSLRAGDTVDIVGGTLLFCGNLPNAAVDVPIAKEILISQMLGRIFFLEDLVGVLTVQASFTVQAGSHDDILAKGELSEGFLRRLGVRKISEGGVEVISIITVVHGDIIHHVIGQTAESIEEEAV